MSFSPENLVKIPGGWYNVGSIWKGGGIMPCYLIDLDGTIYRGREVLPGAAAFVEALERAGRPYRFLTNAAERDPREIEGTLRRMGVPAPEGAVVSAAHLAADLLRELSGEEHPRAAVFGTEFFREFCRREGLVLTEEGPEFLLMSFSEELTMGDIRRACGLIRRGARFTATHPDRLIPGEGGLLPYMGGILEAMTAATGVEPIIAGKPSGHIRGYFTRLFGCPAGDIRMVGDQLETDMALARNCGFEAWLLLTGSTSPEEAARHPGEFDRCFAGMGEVLEECL